MGPALSRKNPKTNPDRNSRPDRGGVRHADEAGEETDEGQDDERLPAPGLVGEEGDDDRAGDASGEHQGAEGAGLGDGEAARPDDVLDPRRDVR